MAIGITGANNGYSRPAADNRFIQTAGGTVTGNLTVTGTLSTTLLEALSANITVIDIKQYELSGFNVQGNVTVQGSVSASNNIIGAKLGAGIVPTQLIHSYSASDANTGIRAQVNTNWIDIRGNNGSGIPGIRTSGGLLDLSYVIVGGHGGGGSALRVKQNGNVGSTETIQNWINASNSTVMTVNSAGSVGIGTTTPAQKLDVVGNITASGSVRVGGTTEILGSFGGSGRLYIRNNTGSADGMFQIVRGAETSFRSDTPLGFSTQVGYVGVKSGFTHISDGVVGVIAAGGAVGSSGGELRAANITASGDITASGHLAAATKAFVIPHQTKPDKQLQHGCLEGPENSVYIRGTTSDSTIVLPDYWDWLVHEDSVTVTVTPVGKFQPLYVVSQDNMKVVVGGVEDKYNYTIYGTRKDVKPLEVEI